MTIVTETLLRMDDFGKIVYQYCKNDLSHSDMNSSKVSFILFSQSSGY